MPNSKTVLVPGSEIGISLITKLLADKASVIGVMDFNQAINLATRDIDLIVCSMSFADSQMFDFLKVIKTNPKTSSIAFLCFNAVHTDLSKTILEAVTIASKTLGAIDFIDFWSLAKQYSIEEAEHKFQVILIDLLNESMEQDDLTSLSIGLGQNL